jgi:hypothetical protein
MKKTIDIKAASVEALVETTANRLRHTAKLPRTVTIGLRIATMTLWRMCTASCAAEVGMRRMPFYHCSTTSTLTSGRGRQRMLSRLRRIAAKSS